MGIAEEWGTSQQKSADVWSPEAANDTKDHRYWSNKNDEQLMFQDGLHQDVKHFEPTRFYAINMDVWSILCLDWRTLSDFSEGWLNHQTR